jgi:peptidoglycan hydrolase-like protein with peptidoglycan-binding domain
MGGKCFEWMCANAPKYGFYLQGNNAASKEFEAWHWQYALGDSSPDGSVQVSAEALKPSGGSVEAGPMNFEYPGTPVGLGSKGVSASLVQAMIGAKADGDFGPKSVASLKAWQTANGLTADGSVGPVTWKKMFG